MGSPVTAIVAADHGVPDAACGYTPAVWSTKVRREALLFHLLLRKRPRQLMDDRTHHLEVSQLFGTYRVSKMYHAFKTP